MKRRGFVKGFWFWAVVWAVTLGFLLWQTRGTSEICAYYAFNLPEC